ncbi:NUDIX domain-containing protein [Microbacterium sp.]|uniref:NUDIX domain-containing protein n=1 Tax=Microbacterium sp. TaxID=51671 RepID=UPI0037CB257A
MSIEPPVPGEPRRPFGPRDSGDAWVVADSGERYWGRFGAAGLLAYDTALDSVLLQHRVSWSHFGGTWALPGGARHEGESAMDAALREALEEAGVPGSAIRPRATSVLDLDIWSYTTVIGDVVVPFAPVISDPESHALEWVRVDEVVDHPLHPSFEEAWSSLRSALHLRPVVVVDMANVVGSVPDGWWKDRAGATDRLLDRLEALAVEGLEASALELPATRWFPRIIAVVEGAARGVDDRDGLVELVRAEASGDDAIVEAVTGLDAGGAAVTVVTSDAELTRRSERVGATVHGVRWVLDRLA